MNLRDLIFAILFFSLAIALSAAIMIGIGSEYPDLDYGTAEDNFSQNLNQIEAITLKIQDMNSSLRSVDISPATAIHSMSIGVWSIMLITMNSVGIIDVMLQGIAITLGIPPWIVSIILTIISVSIIFAIIAAIFWRQPVV